MFQPIDPATAIDVTLAKAKYRIPGRILRRSGIDPPEGTGVYSAGKFKAKSSNAGTKGKAGQTLKPRRKAYGPW